MSRDAWGVVASVILSGVFIVSGVAKLAHPAQWRTQSRELGVPWTLGRLVPYVEVGLAALLLVQWQRHLAAWCAVALLVAFTMLLGVRLAQGRRPPCACFGSLSARPIGPSTIVRNVVLIALAVAAATL